MIFLTLFTVAAVSFQALASAIVAWLVLDCQLAPTGTELHEVTLMKLLYLYDPEACNRIYLYNYTITLSVQRVLTTIVWPVKNPQATAFRGKIQLYVILHVLWLVFYLVYLTQKRRPAGFYALLIPFTLTGLGLLMIEFVYMVLFLVDIKHTSTEYDILHYIDQEYQGLRWINKSTRLFLELEQQPSAPDDITWLPLIFAYCSIGGVIQCVFNFWIVKDNYFRGLECYRKMRQDKAAAAALKREMSRLSYRF